MNTIPHDIGLLFKLATEERSESAKMALIDYYNDLDPDSDIVVGLKYCLRCCKWPVEDTQGSTHAGWLDGPGWRLTNRAFAIRYTEKQKQDVEFPNWLIEAFRTTKTYSCEEALTVIGEAIKKIKQHLL
jgi:hypothetical protein